MKTLYTKEEFNAAGGGDKLLIECCSCGKPFLKLKRVILRTLRGIGGYTGEFCSSKCRGVSMKKKERKPVIARCKNGRCNREHDGSYGGGKFCSRACANSRHWRDKDKLRKSVSNKNSKKCERGRLVARRKVKRGWRDGKYKSRKKIVGWKCPVCGRILEMRPCEAKKRKYCGGRCRNEINNKNQIGARSYAERYLEKRLIECFPDLKIIFNSRQILKNNRELDVYIPSLKIAIEWNGIYHYRKIKNENIADIKKRDLEKKKECNKYGISLYVIKDLTSSRRFIRDKTEKVICIIRGLIQWQDSLTPNEMP